MPPQKPGYAVRNLEDKPENMAPLFETILDAIPAPEGDPDGDTQVLISTIDYNEYVAVSVSVRLSAEPFP